MRRDNCDATDVIRHDKFTLIRPHTCLAVEDINLESCVSDTESHAIHEADRHIESDIDIHADSIDDENRLDTKDDDMKEVEDKRLKENVE
jgi:hypothetical protein